MGGILDAENTPPLSDAEFEKVRVFGWDQCDHVDGAAECFHFGDREGRDG